MMMSYVPQWSKTRVVRLEGSSKPARLSKRKKKLSIMEEW